MNQLIAISQRRDVIRRRRSYRKYKELYDRIESECRTPGDVLRLIWDTTNDSRRFGWHHLAVKAAESIELVIEENERR